MKKYNTENRARNEKKNLVIQNKAQLIMSDLKVGQKVTVAEQGHCFTGKIKQKNESCVFIDLLGGTSCITTADLVTESVKLYNAEG